MERGGFRETATSVFQVVNVGADLEGGTQLDVHGGHEMLLLQQQQGLSVNLLRQELGGELLAACEEEGEKSKERDENKGVKRKKRAGIYGHLQHCPTL